MFPGAPGCNYVPSSTNVWRPFGVSILGSLSDTFGPQAAATDTATDRGTQVAQRAAATATATVTAWGAHFGPQAAATATATATALGAQFGPQALATATVHRNRFLRGDTCLGRGRPGRWETGE